MFNRRQLLQGILGSTLSCSWVLYTTFRSSRADNKTPDSRCIRIEYRLMKGDKKSEIFKSHSIGIVNFYYDNGQQAIGFSGLNDNKVCSAYDQFKSTIEKTILENHLKCTPTTANSMLYYNWQFGGKSIMNLTKQGLQLYKSEVEHIFREMNKNHPEVYIEKWTNIFKMAE